MQNLTSISIQRCGVLALAVAVLGLAGCSGFVQSAGTVAAPVVPAGTPFQGSVHGGQPPVSGATVQLYAANTSGYSTSSYTLLTTAVTSDVNGNFSITGDYTCPSSTTLVYIVATGGNPGGGTNPNLSLMAALGPCGNLSSTTYVTVNELTTVASVYALSPFMSSYSSVSSSSTNTTGLMNAFTTVNTLSNIGAGSVPGVVNSGASVPTSELNTLADILAACVNTTGGTAGDGSGCGRLFSYATPNGGTAPTDTIGAALDIARNPSNNVSSLLTLANVLSPFQPIILTATDLTVSVKYTTGFSTPSAAAVDTSGNLWVTNSGNNSVSEIGPSGATVGSSPYSGSGLSSPSGIAFDASGNAWITDKGSNNTLTVITSAGTASQQTVNGLTAPTAISIDGQGYLWVPNGSQLTQVTVSGTTVSSSQNYTSGGVNAPVAVAVNPN